jgi:hypothetical protein
MNSPHRNILMSTVGIVFLATPFRGSDFSKPPRWDVVVTGTMGDRASKKLIGILNENGSGLRKLTQSFAEMSRQDSLQLPLWCFYEMLQTEMPRSFAMGPKTYKIVRRP